MGRHRLYRLDASVIRDQARRRGVNGELLVAHGALAGARRPLTICRSGPLGWAVQQGEAAIAEHRLAAIQTCLAPGETQRIFAAALN